MWVKLYGENAKGIPAEWPMEVREKGEKPGPDWTDMTWTEYRDYRAVNAGKYDQWERAQPPKVEPVEDIFSPEQRAEIVKMIKEFKP